MTCRAMNRLIILLFCFALQACGDCGETPQVEQKSLCPASECEVGAVSCNAQGNRTVCVEQEGCGRYIVDDPCQEGLVCMSGECVEPPNVPELQELDPSKQPMFTQAQTTYPIDSRVVIIPQEAFFAALEGREFQRATKSTIDLAVETAVQANDNNVIGATAYINNTQSFVGDVFLIPMNPRLVPNESFQPQGLLGSRIEFDRYYVVAAQGLSGYTPWVGTTGRQYGIAAIQIPSQSCCGTQSVMCGPLEVEVGPLPPGPDQPCGGGKTDCPLPYLEDFLEPVIVQTGDVPPRFGYDVPTENDEEGLTERIAFKGNGQPLVALYTLDAKTAYTNPNLNQDPSQDPNFRQMPLFGGFGANPLGCDFCAVTLCENEHNFDHGTFDPPSVANSCGIQNQKPDPVCMAASAGTLSASCGGFCGGCADRDTVESALCHHIGGLPGTGSISVGALAIQSTGCTPGGSGQPDYCKYVDSTDGACGACDAQCQSNVQSFMADTLGCGQGKTPSPGFSCCEGGGSCVCQGDFCQSCNENGDCFRFTKKSLFDGKLFDGDANCRATTVRGVVCSNVSSDTTPEERKTILSNFCAQRGCTVKENSYDVNGTWAVEWPPGEKKAHGEYVDLNKDKKIGKPVAGKTGGFEAKTSTADPSQLVTRYGYASPKKKVEDKASKGGDGTGKKANSPAPPQDRKKPNHRDLNQVVVAQDHRAIVRDGEQGGQRTEGGDPVLLSTGEFTLEQADLSFPGIQRPLEFRRSYGSQSDDRSALGSNWTHNYNVKLVPIKPTNAPSWVSPYCKAYAPQITCVMFIESAGTGKLFYLDASSVDVYDGPLVFTPQSGSTSTLLMLKGGGGWKLRHADGHVLTFNSLGYLVEDRDRFGNGFVIQYEPTPLFMLYFRYCYEQEGENPFKKINGFDARLCSVLGHALGDISEVKVDLNGVPKDSKLGLPVELYATAAPRDWEVEAGYVGNTQESVRRYKQQLFKARAHATDLFRKDILPIPAYGMSKLRPVFVMDDLGRSLSFEYAPIENCPERPTQSVEDAEKEEERLKACKKRREMAGMLTSVSGPNGTRVVFEYDRPDGYPARLVEWFLTKVSRQDRVVAKRGVVARSLLRSVEFVYNWPQKGQSSYDSATPNGDGRIIDALLRQYGEYWGLLIGCSFGPDGGGACSSPEGWSVCVGNDTIYGAPDDPTVSNCGFDKTLIRPGNPCRQAQVSVDHYISQVADNITQVTRHNGKVRESETMYEVDPNSLSFDRVKLQRYGGTNTDQYLPPYNQNPSHETSTFSPVWNNANRPLYQISYLGSGPVSMEKLRDDDGDRTDVVSFLPDEVKEKYKVEPNGPQTTVPCYLKKNCSKPPGAKDFEPGLYCSFDEYKTDSQKLTFAVNKMHPNFPNNELSQSICDPNRAAEKSMTMPGWVPSKSYVPLSETVDKSQLVRSRMTCNQLARRAIGDANHNGLMFGLKKFGSDWRWERLPNSRQEQQDNMRRICQWVRVQDRDGDITFYGLNYKGQTLVEAQNVNRGVETAFYYTEYLYNADGQLIESRNPVTGNGAWDKKHGYIEYVYDAFEPDAAKGWNGVMPLWWSKRGNLIETREYPRRSNNRTATLTHRWLANDNAFENPQDRQIDTGEIAYRRTLLGYEPLFNQLQGTKISAVMKNGEERVYSKVIYTFDYQEFDRDSSALKEVVKDAFLGLIPNGLLNGDDEVQTFWELLLPLQFYNQNVNEDTGLNGSPIIGFPSFDSSQTPKARAFPILMERYGSDSDNSEAVYTMAQPNMTGKAVAVISPQNGMQLYSYYPSFWYLQDTNANFGPANIENAATAQGPYFGGLLAQVQTQWFDLDYDKNLLHKDGQIPHQAPCKAFGGPYQWVLPSGCQDKADAEQKLNTMGFPQEAAQALLNTGIAGGIQQRSTMRLTYDEGGFVHQTNHNGRIRIFSRDTDGRLRTVQDSDGSKTTLTLDDDGHEIMSTLEIPGERDRRVIQQVDDDGRTLTRCVEISFGACSFVLSKTIIPFDFNRANKDQNPEYLLTTYRYTPEGLLHATQDARNVQTTYVYDGRGYVVSVTTTAPNDPTLEPRKVTYEYDDEGEVTSRTYGTMATQQQSGTFKESFVRDGFGSVRTYTDTRGTSWHFAYDHAGRLAAQKQAPINEPYGPQYAPTSWEILYGHDELGRATYTNAHGLTTSRRIYAPGTELVLRSDVYGGSSRWFTYLDDGAVAWSIDEDGNQGFSILERYLTTSTSPSINERVSRAWNISVASDSRGDAVGLERYLVNASLSEISGKGIPVRTVAMGHRDTTANPMRMESTVIDYNALGHVREVLTPERSRIKYSYNSVGWRTSVSVQKERNTTLYDTSRTQYNAYGQPVLILDPSPTPQETRIIYDDFGNVSERYLPITGNAQAHERMLYDGYNRVTDHFLVKENQQQDHLQMVYDAKGDPTQVRWENSPLPSQKIMVERTFDTLGRMTRIEDHNLKLAHLGQSQTDVVVSYGYDALGRVLSEELTLPGQGFDPIRTTTSYAANGSDGTWSEQLTYPSGRQYTRKQDRLGRLSRIEQNNQLHTQLYWLGSMMMGREQQWNTAQDRFKSLRRVDGFGRRTSINYGVDATSASWWNNYCPGGDPAKCSSALLQLNYKHDVMGRIVSASKLYQHPMINTMGGLKNLDEHRNRWRGYRYNAQGHLTREWQGQLTDTSVLNTIRNHDATQAQVDNVGQQVQALEMIWEREPNVGNLTAIRNANTAQAIWEHVGARASGHKMTSVQVDGSTKSIDHDLRGRMTSGPNYNFDYDPFGRVVRAITKDGTRAEMYLFDGTGRMVQVRDDIGQRETFGYDGVQMVQSMDRFGQFNWEAVWGDGVDTLLEWIDHIDGGKRYIPLRDHRNSIVGMWQADASAPSLMALTDYDGFGRATQLNEDESTACKEQGNNQICMSLEGRLPFGFNSAWRSKRTGLIHMRARLYDPQLGQFISPDPLGYVDSFNMYAFASFDPINGWDPFGLSTKSLSGGAKTPGGTSTDPRAAKQWSTWDKINLAQAIMNMVDLKKKMGPGAKNKLITDSFLAELFGFKGFNLPESARIAIMITSTLGRMIFGGPAGAALIKKGVEKAVKGIKAAKQMGKKAWSQLKKAGSGCKGGKCKFTKCFPPGTNVVMADGSIKPIEKVKQDDKVLAVTKEGQTTQKAVIARVENYTLRLVSIEVSENNQTVARIEATGQHRFQTRERGLVEAQNLAIGDVLVGPDGETSIVSSIASRSFKSTSHNLVIEDDAHFVVEDNGTRFAVESGPEQQWRNTTYPEAYIAQGTLIHTERGLVAIETLNIQDRVLSRNEYTGQLSYQPILRKQQVSKAVWVELLLNDEHNAQTKLVVGPQQRLWVKGTGWVLARDVVEGQSLLAKDGRGLKIVSLGSTSDVGGAWQIEVARSHSFFVGLGWVWLHNQSFEDVQKYATNELYNITSTLPNDSSKTIGMGISYEPNTQKWFVTYSMSGDPTSGTYNAYINGSRSIKNPLRPVIDNARDSLESKGMNVVWSEDYVAVESWENEKIRGSSALPHAEDFVEKSHQNIARRQGVSQYSLQRRLLVTANKTSTGKVQIKPRCSNCFEKFWEWPGVDKANENSVVVKTIEGRNCP